jgi:O-antigen/teichoic acid export membrane protein
VGIFFYKNNFFLAFNKSIGYSFLSKGWLLISGLVTSFLIATHFSSELQGYYYAFNSLLILTVFAELGLTSVLVNFISHEWLKIDIDENGAPFGDANSLSRLMSLCHFSIKWFFCAAMLITIVLVVLGWFFWSESGEANITWRAPWVALAVVTGLNLIFLPVTAILEGCNQIENLYRYRFIQYFISSIVMWLGITLGAGLWVASLSTFFGLITLIYLSWKKYRSFFGRVFFNKPQFDQINWRHDVLPMQWRIALSWIGGYFTFALFVPILFRYHGPALAGQMGMTWAFIGALMSISSAWIAPHGPSFGLLVAGKNFSELDARFKMIFIANTCLVLISSIILLLALITLDYLHPLLAQRLLPPSITLVFLVGTVIYTMGLPLATYLRAHKKEPLTAISIFGGILNGVMVVILGVKFGAMGIAIGYLISNLIIFPFLLRIWLNKRKKWHQ